MSTVKVTDESFQADVLSVQPACPRGLLGGMVRSLQADRPGPGADRPRNWPGKVTIAKLNIEQSPTTPSRYGVRGIPTMMLFKDGQMASMKVGAMPKQKILEWLAEAGVSA